jgi:hypothetical protein
MPARHEAGLGHVSPNSSGHIRRLNGPWTPILRRLPKLKKFKRPNSVGEMRAILGQFYRGYVAIVEFPGVHQKLRLIRGTRFGIGRYQLGCPHYLQAGRSSKWTGKEH